MPKPVRKAVFPVAGLGTRFLPATKAMPKEMLPVVDKPLIQYAIEEAKAAGIEEFYFVTGRDKNAIEDHFDTAFELEATLREREKKELLDQLQASLPAAGQIAYTRQQRPLGLDVGTQGQSQDAGRQAGVLLHFGQFALAQLIDKRLQPVGRLDIATGFVVLEELKIVENFDLAAMGLGSADLVHVLVEAKKLAFADRERWGSDPRTVEPPFAEILSAEGS